MLKTIIMKPTHEQTVSISPLDYSLSEQKVEKRVVVRIDLLGFFYLFNYFFKQVFLHNI